MISDAENVNNTVKLTNCFYSKHDQVHHDRKAKNNNYDDDSNNNIVYCIKETNAISNNTIVHKDEKKECYVNIYTCYKYFRFT